MIGVRRIALTLAALTVVCGCSSDAKTTAASSASAATSASSAPTTTSPSTLAGEDQFAECGDVPVAPVQTVTADFDGDSVEDRVVDVVCETPTAGAPHLLVAFVGDRREVLVGVCVAGAPTCTPEVEENQVVGDSNLTIDETGRVVFRGRGYSPSAPLCCPDLDVRRAFRWEKTKFVEEAA
jgi:hypothetical protein